LIQLESGKGHAAGASLNNLNLRNRSCNVHATDQ
jgi:hypothetical protein